MKREEVRWDKVASQESKCYRYSLERQPQLWGIKGDHRSWKGWRGRHLGHLSDGGHLTLWSKAQYGDPPVTYKLSVLGMKSEITHALDPLGMGCHHRTFYAWHCDLELSVENPIWQNVTLHVKLPDLISPPLFPWFSSQNAAIAPNETRWIHEREPIPDQPDSILLSHG